MKREERTQYKENSLFTFDEMMNQKLDRWESSALKNNVDSMVLSLIVDMFRFIGDTRNAKDILDECFTDKKWYEAHTWTTKQYNEWVKTHAVPVLRKRWKISKSRAERESSWFSLQYSFKVVD